VLEAAYISPGGAVRLRIILFGLVGLTLFFAIYPDPAIAAFGFSNASNDFAIRLFAGINAVLLTWASVLGGRTLHSRNPHVLSTRFAELDKLSSEARFPLPVCLIYDRYPSVEPEAADTIRQILKSASIMASMKPLIIRDLRELQSTLDQVNVTCVLADEKFYDDLWPSCRRNKTVAFFFSRASRFSAKITMGRAEVEIRLDCDMENISGVANELVRSFSHDTPRGLGFRGNWMTTYGLMSLEQDRYGEVEGVYWYGGGTIHGTCTIDSDQDVLVLEYEWSQTKRPSKDIGSQNDGFGIFYLPAGYEAFLGHWYNKGELDTIQPWCGCRLSGDIVRSMLKGGSYSRDLGLSQHPNSKLINL
jgi:hypothetical protein